MFSEPNARAHIQMLAGTIGSRPVGTPANARARAYIIDQLELFGFDVRVQEADARRAEFGLTARVSNIIATLPGERTDAVGLVSHYDSVPEAPGAADAGFGVAIALEAARVLAARNGRRWTLFVLLTDGEEAGLMGAAALMTDREVTDRLRAYLNLEAVGSSGPSLLFETGPGNGWLVAPWARHAPHPRGGSFALEIYRRLPNDTDFTILKRREIPGLNFASTGDSYAYHTPRDVPDRIPIRVVRETGENVVAIVEALNGVDIAQRKTGDATYFDVGGIAALTYSALTGSILAGASLMLGVIACVKMTAAAFRMGGIGRWLLTALWTAAGVLAVFAAMVGVTWALRAAREVYHPWYARPGRLWFLMLATGLIVAWAMSRLGEWMPARLHGPRHPAVTWSLVLPVWIVLTTAMFWVGPAAAYLWTVPLFTAGATLSVIPARNGVAIRMASIVILAVTATLWLRDTFEFLRFMVAMFGRLAVITPILAYASLMMLAGIMIVPPFIAIVASPRPVPRPSFVTAVLLMTVAIAAGLAYLGPAYTYERPLRRYVRAVQELDSVSASWQVASVEPGLDLSETAPAGWSLENSRPPSVGSDRPSEPGRSPQSVNRPSLSVLAGTLRYPFVFRTDGPGLGPPPITVSATRQAVAGGVELAITVIPTEPGNRLTFILPESLSPVRSSLPGRTVRGWWAAAYVAPPVEGVVWRATFAGDVTERLRDVRVAVTSPRFPGGEGWQRLPAWLPQERTVWAGSATWILPVPVAAAAVAPVPPLR